MLTLGMKGQLRKTAWMPLLLALVAGLAAVLWPWPASAHCDSIDGPVVGAARQALEAGDVRLVLPYVKPDAEAELTAAFQQALEVHKLGGQAQSLADRYFFETAVRLHRAGEGAPYTGLKEHAEVSPALAAAEKALESGSPDAVNAALDEAMRAGVAERYQAVLTARAHAVGEGTVAAHRHRVEAELGFEQYVDELYQAMLGKAVHHEAGAAPLQVGGRC